jgi:hypothetical protein
VAAYSHHFEDDPDLDSHFSEKLDSDPDRHHNQCCGSIGVDPDPAIFVIDLQDANKKSIF